MIRQILSRWLNKRRKIWRTYKKFSRKKAKMCTYVTEENR